MRKTILSTWLIYSSLHLHSQGVLEKLYYSIPSQYTRDLSYNEKKEQVAFWKANPVDPANATCDYFDEKNGYVNFACYQCDYEMCYWNVLDTANHISKRVVAVLNNNCGGDIPIFFEEKEGVLTPFFPKEILGFNAWVFFKDETKLKDIKELSKAYYFKLPKKGLKITVEYVLGYGEKPKSNLLKGDKIDFIWDNGDFKMGPPYF